MSSDQIERVHASERPPGCPVCGTEMVWCTVEDKEYWACPVAHDPPGIVQKAQEVDWAFAFALTGVLDVFGAGGVSAFRELEEPGDVAGHVTDQMLGRLDLCYETKQITEQSEQQSLGEWSG